MIKQNFARIIAYLAAAYGDKKITSATADVYWDLLQDLPDDAVFTAVKLIASSSSYPTLPPVGAIRKAAVELSTPRLPSAAEAWGEVMSNISRYGYYRAEEGIFALTPVVCQATKCIGYTDICFSENIEATRAHFFRVYEQYANREREMAIMPPAVQKFVAMATASFNSLPE